MDFLNEESWILYDVNQEWKLKQNIFHEANSSVHSIAL